MDQKPDHGEETYRGSGRLANRRSLITGGDSGMGRAAAIAYAREGADVAISYFPSEEPNAREVIQLIQASGRTGIPIPGDLRDERVCQRLVADAVDGLAGLDIGGVQRRSAAIAGFDPGRDERRLRLDHEKGRAVIGGAIGGIRHQIEHGYSGFLVANVEEAASFVV